MGRRLKQPAIDDVARIEDLREVVVAAMGAGGRLTGENTQPSCNGAMRWIINSWHFGYVNKEI